MTKYLNFRSSFGLETVDELSLCGFSTRKEFFKELSRLISEYSIAGMPVYSSQRCCKDWKNK